MNEIRQVKLTRKTICPNCRREIVLVQRHDTEATIELYCLNDGCGVLIVSKPKV